MKFHIISNLGKPKYISNTATGIASLLLEEGIKRDRYIKACSVSVEKVIELGNIYRMPLDANSLWVMYMYVLLIRHKNNYIFVLLKDTIKQTKEECRYITPSTDKERFNNLMGVIDKHPCSQPSLVIDNRLYNITELVIEDTYFEREHLSLDDKYTHLRLKEVEGIVTIYEATSE